MKKETKDKATLHLELSGQAFYDDDAFYFAPDNVATGRMERQTIEGVAHRLTDGTFDFVPRPRYRANSELIKKLPHGRVSKTRDNAIQLTLKFDISEGPLISSMITMEAGEGALALLNHNYINIQK